MVAYYNENDPFAANWLRELIKQGHIAEGEVDTRSIEDVKPSDLAKFTVCHFFAGIGGWPLALSLSGWDHTRPVWTGSCPCQPFSQAGKGAGFADERHLWPAWFHLIRECRPDRIFGEQVASAGEWLDLVSTDLESQGYAFGSAVLGAHSVGAPHIRQRIYWMADANEHGCNTPPAGKFHNEKYNAESCRIVGDAAGQGLPQRRGPGDHPLEPQGSAGLELQRKRSSPWSDCEWIKCRDGKARPIKPSIFPLAHGVSARVGKLRGAGNAIVPQVAAEFIKACQ